MAHTQSTYRETQFQAVLGLVANSNPCTIDTYIVDESGGIGFGRVVKQGTDDDQCDLGADGPSSSPFAVTDFLGIALMDMSQEGSHAASARDEYPNGAVASVLSMGDVWVSVAAAVTAGDDVTVDDGTGRLSTITAADGQFLIPGARWMTTQATANGLAIVRLTGALGAAS